MDDTQVLSPAKRKRLLKTYGNGPPGYTHEDIERLLDVLYGLFSHIYTTAEIQHLVINNPFDRSETPRQLKLVELTEWLEAVLM